MSAAPAFVLTPYGYRDIGLRYWWLASSGRFDPVGAAMADRHYSRQTPGSPQFMPPGQTIVLIGQDMSSVFGWWRSHDCGPDGLLTYVGVRQVCSPNPGYCFQRAGWTKRGWSADGRKRLLTKAFLAAHTNDNGGTKSGDI